MARKSFMKKLMIVSILTACLGTNFFAAEAAPPKRGGYYPYPSQQQSQQNSRPTMQQPRPSSPRPTVQQPRHNSPRPTMQQPRPSSPRPTIQQPRHNSPRPTVQQPRHNSPRPTMQQPKHNSTQQTVQHSRRWKPKYPDTRQEKPRLQEQEPKHRVAKPVIQEPKRAVVKPVTHEPKHGASKLVVQEPKHSVVKPVVHKHKRSMAKPVIREPKYRDVKSVVYETKHVKHKKQGPRKDLLRPPVQRTYANMHIWRRPPKPPKDHWRHHRPAYRPGRYRGYYCGVYYTDVLSTLLAAEIIHSPYDTYYTNVVNYVDASNYSFIPKEAIKYKGHHYLVFSDIGKSMEDAQQFCESMGGHLATVGDDDKNARLYRLINDSGFDNEYFEKYGYDRFIPNEPVTYEKAVSDSNSEEEVYYGLYYWNYKNVKEDGTIAGTGGNAFVCEWDK